VVLVSDAGGLFTEESDKGLLWRIPRIKASRSARPAPCASAGSSPASTRARSTAPTGASAAPRPGTPGTSPGYSKSLAREVIAEIRTDLDAFSDAEAAVLENHGYLLADAAIRRHVPALRSEPIPPAAVPYPDWFPPARSEDAIRATLTDSGKRKTWGRG
jgi:hypothetical protein